jgi:hypothetical protein
MSKTTRINRPTTATPRNVGTRRYMHVSTDYRWLPVDSKNPLGQTRFVKVGKGSTYYAGA